MAGNDLRAMSAEVREILTAPEVVAVNQDARGAQGRRLRADGDAEVWIRELSGARRHAVALLNRGSAAREIQVAFADLGITGAARVRDLWERAGTEMRRDAIATTVAAHDAALFLVESS